jgi:hypothetical protein
MIMKTFIVSAAVAFALCGIGRCDAAEIAEIAPASRVGNVTRDKKRDPGLFGAHWWANRFLSRHMEIEKYKGKSVDVVLIGDSIMHFWEWKYPASWKKFTANRTVLNLGYGGDRTQNLFWRIDHGELDPRTPSPRMSPPQSKGWSPGFARNSRMRRSCSIRSSRAAIP